MTRPPDRAIDVKIDELAAWSYALDRIKTSIDDAVQLRSATDTICTYNYKSGAKAMTILSSFAEALNKAVMAHRGGNPLRPGQLKPRSTASKLPTPEAATAKAKAQRAAKKSTKKKPD